MDELNLEQLLQKPDGLSTEESVQFHADEALNEAFGVAYRVVSVHCKKTGSNVDDFLPFVASFIDENIEKCYPKAMEDAALCVRVKAPLSIWKLMFRLMWLQLGMEAGATAIERRQARDAK